MLALVVIAFYARTLGGYFLADDFAYVATSSASSLAAWPSTFLRDESKHIWGYSLGLLRPFFTLSGIIQSHLFGDNATAYRVVSLALHVGNVWFVFAIARKCLLASRSFAFAAALLFAIHPIHAETITWICAQSDLLPTTMFLGAFLAFVVYRAGGSVIYALITVGLSAIAAFTKENTVVLTPLLVAYDLIYFRTELWKPTWRRSVRIFLPYVGLVLVLALYFAARRIAFGGGAGVPALTSGSGTLVQTVLARYFEYLAYLSTPLDLSAAVRPLATLLAAEPKLVVHVCVALSLTAGAIVAAVRRQYELLRAFIFFGPVWFVALSAPFLFTHHYPRHVYLVSAGFCLFVAVVGKVLLPQRWWAARALLFGALVCGWSVANVKAVTPWRDSGIISRNMHRTIRRLHSRPQGTVLILDLPGAIRGAHLFHWSSPFLLGEPFCSPPLSDRFIILEAPTSYYRDSIWPQHPAIEKIANLDVNTRAYLVVYDESLSGRSVKLDTLKLRNAALGLRTALSGNPDIPLRTKWREFIDSAR